MSYKYETYDNSSFSLNFKKTFGHPRYGLALAIPAVDLNRSLNPIPAPTFRDWYAVLYYTRRLYWTSTDRAPAVLGRPENELSAFLLLLLSSSSVGTRRFSHSRNVIYLYAAAVYKPLHFIPFLSLSLRLFFFYFHRFAFIIILYNKMISIEFLWFCSLCGAQIYDGWYWYIR